MRKQKASLEWQQGRIYQSIQRSPHTCTLFLSGWLSQAYYDETLWLKKPGVSKSLSWSIKGQVNWGPVPNPAGLRSFLGLSAGVFLFLLLCSRSPSAVLAVISAPLAPCLGSLPALLLSSSVGAAQLSKKLLLLCPSHPWKKENTEILAWKAKEGLLQGRIHPFKHFWFLQKETSPN